MKRETWDKLTERLVAFGVDKWMHIVIVMTLAWLVSLILMPFTAHRVMRATCGALAAVIISIMKEVYDERTTGCFDNRDLAADAIGISLFYLIYTL